MADGFSFVGEGGFVTDAGRGGGASQQPYGFVCARARTQLAQRILPPTRAGTDCRRSVSRLCARWEAAAEFCGESHCTDIYAERTVQDRGAAADESCVDRYERARAGSRGCSGTIGGSRRHVPLHERSDSVGDSCAAWAAKEHSETIARSSAREPR